MVELKRIKEEWNAIRKREVAYWRRSLEELLSGTSGKYKELIGIHWLNIHRLYDNKTWRLLRMKLFLWKKEKYRASKTYPFLNETD